MKLRSLTLLASLLVIILVPLHLAPAGELQEVPVTVSVSASSATGSATIPPTFGTLRAVRAVLPNGTGSTWTVTIRDENDVTVWTVASLSKNGTRWVQPTDDTGWPAGSPVPIASGTRGTWGIGGTDVWDVLMTSATPEASTRSISLTLYVEQE